MTKRKYKRCDCAACDGRTIHYTRSRLVKALREAVNKGAFTSARMDELIAQFDAQHGRKKKAA